MTPNSIAEHFESSRQAVSKHIHFLMECELLEQEKEGREIYYLFKSPKEMKNAFHMNFFVDRKNKKIKVEREFDAPIDMVWSAWTESELPDQWWAPKPWKAKTKFIDFKEGGFWLYAMVSPEGEKHWARADFLQINPMLSFTSLERFCMDL